MTSIGENENRVSTTYCNLQLTQKLTTSKFGLQLHYDWSKLFDSERVADWLYLNLQMIIL